jgi:sulfate/thiosulfate transport system substrate-binding protein
MFNNIKSRWLPAAAVAVTATLLAGCGGGGSSDTAGGGGSGGGAATTLTLVAYSVPQPGWDKVIAAFTATPEGKGIAVTPSYGASGDQSRGVVDGKPADLVNFSVEPDITRLVKANKVAKDWNSGVTKGIGFTSVVTLVVRKGNPKNIHDWDDLLQPGLEVVTPNPLSSGSAKWNLLAPYAAKSNGGQDAAAGLDYINKLVTEHVKTRPASGKDATTQFVGGTGDVLISYENEAINTERQGSAVEHVTPPQTFKIENPVAVTTTTAHPDQAKALEDYVLSPEGQKVWAEAGFRPVDPSVLANFSKDFPAPQKLWTIDDLGGWSAVDPALFDKDNGSITKIYKAATG